MSLFDDFGAHVAEDKREAFKAAVANLDGAVKIDSRESVEKLADNPFMKSYLDSQISRAVTSHDEKFKAEKLPGMIEDEIKRRAPKPKDPVYAELEERLAKQEKRAADAEAEAVRIAQLAKVLPKLTEMGLDHDMAEDFIGQSDEITDAKLARLEKAFTKARDTYTERILKERFGNQGTPPAGGYSVSTKEQLIQQMNELAKNPANYQKVLILQEQINSMK